MKDGMTPTEYHFLARSMAQGMIVEAEESGIEWRSSIEAVIIGLLKELRQNREEIAMLTAGDLDSVRRAFEEWRAYRRSQNSATSEGK